MCTHVVNMAYRLVFQLGHTVRIAVDHGSSLKVLALTRHAA